jgi:KipI family sensor histidine kinase inhibitor
MLVFDHRRKFSSRCYPLKARRLRRQRPPNQKMDSNRGESGQLPNHLTPMNRLKATCRHVYGVQRNMMASIDINADLGEGVMHQGVSVDILLMPHVSSASIACGGHAGDEAGVMATIKQAMQHGVAAGAHPSFVDRENFGRMPADITPGALADVIADQLALFLRCAKRLQAKPHHLKPHGALYHAVGRDEQAAGALVRAVRWLHPALVLYGLPGSALERAAQQHGLAFAAEAFPDRAYHDDGTLVDRSVEGSVISEPHLVASRALSLARDGRIQSISGSWIRVRADTLCIHSDTPDAPALAAAVNQSLCREGIPCAIPALQTPLAMESMGENALRIVCGHEISASTTLRVRTLDAWLREHACPGITEVVPAYADLVVFFDPAQVTVAELAAKIRAGEPPTGEGTYKVEPAREHLLPVRYGGSCGPDLTSVADMCGMTPEEVVRRHAEKAYPVHMLGFSPGFCYLGDLDDALETPRQATPRVRVASGSVAVAGRQTGIYPVASPGGWNIIGRTGARLFDPSREQPFLIQPGDTVRFVPVDESISSPSPGAPEERAVPETVAPTRQGDTENRPYITIEAPGMLTTVQDGGRHGYRRYGVPTGGAMDQDAYRSVNHRLGNPAGAAVLEITLHGPVIRFHGSLRFAICGARTTALLNGTPLAGDGPHDAHDGDILSIGSLPDGCRAYLGFAGGVDVPVIMGSRSTCLAGGFGGYQGRVLRAGDRLFIGPGARGFTPADEPVKVCELEHDDFCIRISPGPEVDWFTPEALGRLLSGSYRIEADSNRAGYRLRGASLPRRHPEREMISSPVTIGTVQIARDGQPVILLADGPTVGGYPRVGIVHREDLSRLARLRPGHRLRFIECSSSRINPMV